MRRTQDGYGVIIPDERAPRNFGIQEEDSLFITDVTTGKRRLLVSIAEVFEQAKIPRDKYEQGECYGFHCKYNPQGDRLLFTMRADGSDIAVAVGPEYCQHGDDLSAVHCEFDINFPGFCGLSTVELLSRLGRKRD
jgi:hypothetical protein